MKSGTIHSFVSAAEEDYKYWNSIQENTEALHVSRATAFYIQFLEKIINGLNAISRYHNTEEFVGRFIQRKHFFSLHEEEFSRFSSDLADEIVASGYTPLGQFDREMVVSHIREKCIRWYYLLDEYDSKQFRKQKEIITDLVSYDLTTVFYPSNLDRELLYSYAGQFESVQSPETVTMIIAEKIGLDPSYAGYLIFMQHMPESWENQIPADNATALDNILKRISRSISASIQITRRQYSKASKQIKKYLHSEIQSHQLYQYVQKNISSGTSLSQVQTSDDTQLRLVAQGIAQQLKQVPDFPSNQYDDDSVASYLFEKLLAWREMIQGLNTENIPRAVSQELVTDIMIHDILRGLSESSLDTHLLRKSEYLADQDKGILLVIAGKSLKFSDKFVQYELLLQHIPNWKSIGVDSIPMLTTNFSAAVQDISEVYRRFKKLPKSHYNRLTKAFTSYYTIKKGIELYFEHKYGESDDYLDLRIEQLYKKYIRKGTKTDSTERVQELMSFLQHKTKQIPEQEFDDILASSINLDMAKQQIDSFADYLENDQNREKLQYYIFKRYDDFLFNRIMNRNYAGLANLFGTKGFIILIEVYLIGSGIEYVINHTIEYWVTNSITIISFFQNLLFSPNLASTTTLLSPPEDRLVPASFDFSLQAFSTGWATLDWGRTSLSLLIPIMLMFLITGYNYVFHKLNRKNNRLKSFKALKTTTQRWLNGTRHAIELTQKKRTFLLFELFRISILVLEVYAIISLLVFFGFEPIQIGLFFFLLTTICLSAYQGNKLKEEITLNQSEMISDTIRDIVFIPILEIGRFLSGSAKSLNFIPWLVREGVEPLYKPVAMFLQSFVAFQKEKKDELIS